MYTPNGYIRLLKTDFDSTNSHVVKFDTYNEQSVYFLNLPDYREFTKYAYVRSDIETGIKVNIQYDDAIKYNYVMFNNQYFSNYYMYAFIERCEYINDACVKFHVKLDVWQTFQFKLNYNLSFIERRHDTSSSVNTLVDNVSEGSLIEYNSMEVTFKGGFFVFCNSDVTQEDTTNSSQYSFKLDSYSIPSMVLFYTEAQAESLSMDLQKIANKGYGDRVNSCVYVPVCGNIDTLVVTPVNTYPVCSGTEYPDDILKQEVSYDLTNVVTNFDYSKSLTFPYAKIVVQDLATGQTIELELEKFDSKLIKFEIQSTISETPSYKIIPLNYKNQEKSYKDAMVVKCNTSLPTANNLYAKYLYNNQDFNNLRMLGGSVGAANSLINGSPMGTISSFESITNIMLQERQAQKQPNQLSSITDGALERINFQNGIKISLFVMDNSHMKIANDYWKMYGYPQKCIGYPSPHLDSKNFEYIKSHDINLSGEIPQIYLNEIQDMFNRGVTVWKKDKYRQYV